MTRIMPLGLVLFGFTLAAMSMGPSAELKPFRLVGYAQGTTYHITYYAKETTLYQEQIDRVLQEIDSSLSIYKPYSRISAFNAATRGVSLDRHLRAVIDRSLQLYTDTRGAFDITVYPLVDAWGFGKRETIDSGAVKNIRSLLSCVGSSRIHLKGDSLVKDKPCVKIDVNGIAQGYSVDVLVDFVEANGILNYLVELGGEVRIRGRKFPGNRRMSVGIESVSTTNPGRLAINRVLELDSGAVTTSGTFRNYKKVGGQMISHLIDPKTGFPVQNDLISVTVLAHEAMTADGYDNALMAMGLRQSLQFLARHPELQAYFIYKKPDGTIADTATTTFLHRLRSP